MKTKEEILTELPYYTCTEGYHSSGLMKMNITDGVHFIREACDAYWLIEVIESYQIYANIRAIEYQSWVLKVKDGKGVVTMTDCKTEKVMVTQKIPYTDFPLDSIEIWIENGVMLLPREH